MKLKKCTPEQVKKSKIGDYNPAIWKSNVDRYLAYENPEFYSYSDGSDKRFFVVYTIKEGIRFIQQISFGGCLSNAGFKMVKIRENGDVEVIPFMFEGGRIASAKNTPANRKQFAKMTKEFGTIFTNEL